MDSSLCHQCTELDFDSIFDESNLLKFEDESGIVVAQLGRRLQSTSLRDCDLCRLLASVRVPSDSPRDDELRAFSFLQSFGEVDPFEWRRNRFNPNRIERVKDFVILGVVPYDFDPEEAELTSTGLPDVDRIRRRAVECGKRGFITQIAGATQEAQGFRGWVVNDRVDIDYLRSMLHFCRGYHTEGCCSTQSKNDAGILKDLPMLKVVDCFSGNVVPYNGKTGYATLSYVCAQTYSDHIPLSALGKVTVKGAAKGSFPKVIDDAMEVTRALGLKYLWIDKYCINQDDADERSRQIMRMNLIYSASEFTIVAAGTDEPWYGLPGVSQTPRLSQPSARVSSGLLVSTLPRPGVELLQSRWATRGWTLQEGILSARRICFGPHQVYFECDGMHAYESLQMPIELLHTPAKQRYLPTVRAGVFGGMLTDSRLVVPTRMQSLVDGPLQVFWRYVEEYTSRDLGFASDSLNAFQGILTWVATLFVPAWYEGLHPRRICNLWGLPMYLSEDDRVRMLGFALGWRHAESQNREINRRTDFPSWTWAGWEGTVSAGPMELLHDNTNVDLHIGVAVHVKLVRKTSKALVNLQEIEDEDLPYLTTRYGSELCLEAPFLSLSTVMASSRLTHVYDNQPGLFKFTAAVQDSDRTSAVQWSFYIDVRPFAIDLATLCTKFDDQIWKCLILADTAWSMYSIIVEARSNGNHERVGFVEVSRPGKFGQVGPKLAKEGFVLARYTIRLI